jgi:hypothetical protein
MDNPADLHKYKQLWRRLVGVIAKPYHRYYCSGDIPVVCVLLINGMLLHWTFSCAVGFKSLQKVPTWSRKNVSQKFYVGIKKTEIDVDFESVEKFDKRVIQIKIEGRELLYTIFKRWKTPSSHTFILITFWRAVFRQTWKPKAHATDKKPNVFFINFICPFSYLSRRYEL